MVRNQKIALQPKVPAKAPPITGPTAIGTSIPAWKNPI